VFLEINGEEAILFSLAEVLLASLISRAELLLLLDYRKKQNPVDSLINVEKPFVSKLSLSAASISFGLE